MIAGRYSLDREIGRGGSGAVWLGRDELLGRAVALKQAGRLPGATESDRERAAREARLSARLSHPHVVGVYDFVVDEASGEHWLVMEYVDGPTLAQVIRDHGPLDTRTAANVMGQVADALAAAHEAGITHRDVKPSNILMEAGRTAKLTDFGIARTLADPALTQTGLLAGSPAYLAPEVASGERGDMSADVWSFGATLFHVLAGRPPYDLGDNVIGGLYRIVHDEPPRLTDAGPLAPVLEGTMAKDPTQRWSAAHVRDALTEVGRGQQPTRVMTSPPSPVHDETRAMTLPPAPPKQTAEVVTSQEPAHHRPGWLFPAIAAAAVLALIVLVLALNGGNDSGDKGSTKPTPTTSNKPTPTETPAGPTAAGMKAFISDYVTRVGDDPATSWPMLTKQFQKESGGFDTYKKFWDPARNGRVTSIKADPVSLQVTYRVHFDHWKNGPGPTILDLSFDNGRYLIAGERSPGFVPK